jgi:hypothetical protein
VGCGGFDCLSFWSADAWSMYVDRCRQLGFDCEAARILKGCCYPLLNDKTQVWFQTICCLPLARASITTLEHPQPAFFRCQQAYTCCVAAARSQWRALLSSAPTAAPQVSRALCVVCQ